MRRWKACSPVDSDSDSESDSDSSDSDSDMAESSRAYAHLRKGGFILFQLPLRNDSDSSDSSDMAGSTESDSELPPPLRNDSDSHSDMAGSTDSDSDSVMSTRVKTIIIIIIISI